MSILSAALPGAALRMTRTAAGRRALQVGLLVGGLFVLGLLCGERADAADGATSGVTATGVVRSVTGSVERVVTGSVEAVAQSAEQSRAERARPSSEQRSATPESSGSGVSGSETSGSGTSGDIELDGLVRLSDASSEAEAEAEADSSPSTGTGTETDASSGSSSESGAATPSRPRTIDPLDSVHKVTAPVTDPVTDGVHRVVRPVTEQVVRPVTETVVRPVADGVVRPIGGLVEEVVSGGVAKPGAPASPWWPPLRVLPGLELPALPHLPGLPVLPGQTLPVGSQPQLPGGAAEENGSAGHDAGEKSGDRSTGAYGPQVSGGHVAPDAGVRDNDEGARGAAQPPAHQEPESAPRGALGHGSAADNGSPRHGDAHAVAFSNRAQLRLVPGIAAVVTAAETRDRYRDIPVFPG
ncbi:hypothetical protein [Streptomyces yerevanensis]|uniref:hypothetical protein n=1 Tax=Streptomyces yerevanensis TaxID=66378 RepID=UPI0012FEA23B|nr:hypothetical protein [Streptomyces yerevanensis]